MTQRLTGLVAATHTPFDDRGQLNLPAVEQQAAHLLRTGVSTVFVGGSTGESHSLTVEERLGLAEQWAAVARGTPLRVVVHVGSNCLSDARMLAEHAERHSATAISALAPSYFKPRDVEALIACCATVAAAAPATPFYFYDIPSMTGVHFSMPEFLNRAADRIPTLAGIKFTNSDLMAYQRCLRASGGRFDVPWGVDEYLLAAVSLGGTGAVGSSYNFAAPVYTRLLAAVDRGDLRTAREEQYCSVQLIHLLAEYGYMAAAKAVMGMLGVPVGAPRLPTPALAPDRVLALRSELEQLGFFNWVR